MSDYLEPVMRCYHESRVDEMNARMILFHPAFEEDRKDPGLREQCLGELGLPSLSETIRSLMELEA